MPVCVLIREALLGPSEVCTIRTFLSQCVGNKGIIFRFVFKTGKSAPVGITKLFMLYILGYEPFIPVIIFIIISIFSLENDSTANLPVRYRFGTKKIFFDDLRIGHCI